MHDQATDTTDAEILELPGRQVLPIGSVRALSRRSNASGALRVVGHLVMMAATGTLIWFCWDNDWLLPGALVLHGFTIVTMFAPMHECVHKTAFQTPWLNDTIGWWAGALCFYNFTYYRRYHTWHHRYTQDAERDPELSEPKPQSLADYAWHISGIPFWLNKPRELIGFSLGKLESYPYIPAAQRQAVTRSARLQLGLYLLLLIGSLATRSSLVFWYWLLPALVAQPLLRAILIVEHTGCSQDTNGLTNTRTTLASWPVRFLMWNMPYHAEHHLYPSIPFFALPAAHEQLREHFAHIAPSYPAPTAKCCARCRARRRPHEQRCTRSRDV